MTDPFKGYAVSSLMAVLVATSITGCGVFRKGRVQDTPAPPESSAEVLEIEPPETVPEPAADPAPPVLEPPEEAPEVVEPEPVEAEVEPPRADTPPAPPEPVEEATKKVPPAIDEVSPAEQPEPRLLPQEEERLTPESLRDHFEEAQALSAALTGRDLSDEQHAQVESGRGFLEDAREALSLRDLERVRVLLEKCLVLLRDAVANSEAPR